MQPEKSAKTHATSYIVLTREKCPHEPTLKRDPSGQTGQERSVNAFWIFNIRRDERRTVLTDSKHNAHKRHTAPKRKTLRALPRQFCSVLEFSSTDGYIYVPYWMLQNLRVKD
eukprot:561792_1